MDSGVPLKSMASRAAVTAPSERAADGRCKAGAIDRQCGRKLTLTGIQHAIVTKTEATNTALSRFSLTPREFIMYTCVTILIDSAGGMTVAVELLVDPARNLDDIPDELLVECVRVGDALALEFLIQKYKTFVRGKARSYFLIGADREDIVQEGMIGLFKAIRDFRDDKLASFKAFAELCITRQIITAIKTATRQKHVPLNSYISLDKPIYDEDSDRTLMDVIGGAKVTDPEELIINREEFSDIEYKMSELLSELERNVLMLYLDGRSYQEIAGDLRRHVKSIDNALQRVKRKLEKYLEDRLA